MGGWHYWLYGHKFVQAPGIGDEQGSLESCSSLGNKELDTTEQLNWTGQQKLTQHCKSKVKVKVAQSCPTLCDPMDWILEWVAFPFFRGSSQPKDWTRSPTLQGDSLPAEPQGKPKNTGVGSLSLLQQTFPTQESIRDLLHCRRILYQLSCQRREVVNQL